MIPVKVHPQILMRRICQVAAIGLFGIGFAMNGYWLGGLVVGGLAALSWVGERYQRSWISAAILLTSTGIAAGGIWLGVPSIFMISGVIMAIAWSELTGNTIGSIHALDPNLSVMVEHQRIRLLVVLIVTSLLVTGVGLFWKWHLDFGFIFLISVSIGLALFGLFRMLKTLNQ